MFGKRKADAYYPFSDESEAAPYNPIDRGAYGSQKDVGVPVPQVPSRGLVRESGRQIKPPTKMQKIRDVVDEVHIRLPILRGNVDSIMDEAMTRMDLIHNRQDGRLLDPSQLSQEADQSIADLQELELTLVSAQERMRELSEYVQRAQDNIHRKLSQTISVNYSLQQRSLQNVLDQLVDGSIRFEDLQSDQQFMVIHSTPKLQLQDLITRGIIPENMEDEGMTISSGRGGKTKRKQQRKNKTRKKNNQKGRR